eukprot:CAMPEP_0185032304 /NCGR_PEP_ID=MMETSP1103-20130426/20267_1 /TAXON_ID=36769 /ORGANISM="Paraphysomonas bandaiensis, Strain Caron Lab Isolate" /LENGTH=968 /DNA_ID=CAMNT_0027568149 /DNA_START=56 /DNA_END=2962 /DNA_ORIENTATION=+
MSDQGKNVFEMLDDEEGPTDPSTVVSGEVNTNTSDTPSTDEQLTSQDTSDTANDSNAWTDVSSTKSRRLAPQFTLSKQDFGADRSRTAANQEASKKKVIRFTRDEILALRRVTKCVPEMEGMGDIVSATALEPECLQPFDADEVLRIWNSSDSGRKEGPAKGRGRGRGKGGDGDNNQHYGGDGDDAVLWDDIKPNNVGGKTLDLADFAAATLKFSEASVYKPGTTELYFREGDEAMEALMREQEEKIPEWGAEDLPATTDPGAGDGAQGKGNQKGRSLLLETLSVKSQTGSGSGGIVVSDEQPVGSSDVKSLLAAKVQKSTDDTLLESLINDDAALAGDELDIQVPDVLEEDSEGVSILEAGLENMGFDKPAPIPAASGTHTQPATNVATSSITEKVVQVNVADSTAVSASQVPPTKPSPVPPTPLTEEWYYRDPQENVQGPFDTKSMRRWLESGYFKEHLPIRLSRWTEGKFYHLGTVFPILSSAFTGPVMEPGKPMPVKVQSEQHIPHKEARQQEKPLELSTKPASGGTVSSSSSRGGTQQQSQQPLTVTEMRSAPSQQQQPIASVAAASTAGNSSSPNKTKPKKDVAPVPQKSKVKESSSSSSAAGVWGVSEPTTTPTLIEIQRQEEAATRRREAAGETSAGMSARSFQLKNLLGVGGAGGGKSGGVAWGSSPSAHSGSSLRDIQQEQEKDMRVKRGPPAASESGSSQWKVPSAPSHGSASLMDIMEGEKQLSGGSERPVGAGSWASKAGGTRSGGVPAKWIAAQSMKSSDSAIESTTMPVSHGNAPASVPSTTQSSIKVATKPTPVPKKQATTGAKNSNGQQQIGGSSGPTSKKHSSSDLVDWSVMQLKRLNGENKSSTEDIALIEFCLTLKSAVEIREYLADYLGSTPQVSQFATEFIRRKEGKPPTQLRSTAGGTGMGIAAVAAARGDIPGTKDSKKLNAAQVAGNAGKKKKKPKPKGQQDA